MNNLKKRSMGILKLSGTFIGKFVWVKKRGKYWD